MLTVGSWTLLVSGSPAPGCTSSASSAAWPHSSWPRTIDGVSVLRVPPTFQSPKVIGAPAGGMVTVWAPSSVLGKSFWATRIDHDPDEARVITHRQQQPVGWLPA